MKNHTKEFFSPKEMGRTLGAIVGAFLYVVGMNIFVVPAGLYSGGLMGFCQIIRTVMVDYMHLPFGGFDIAGIIYYIMNIPLFFIAYKTMGKLFFMRTVLVMTLMTVFFTIVPIPAELLMSHDILSSCLIGGIISGVGCGLTLMMGGSAGGMDIVGLYYIKKRGNFSVGKVNLVVNFFVYAICFFMSDVTIVIYSLIFAAVSSLALDKVHSQNINVEVIIITRSYSRDMQTEIMSHLGRGITKWSSKGAYTEEGSEILFIILSKYEINQLKRIVHKYDKDAFVVVKEGVWVEGNYLRKL